MNTIKQMLLAELRRYKMDALANSLDNAPLTTRDVPRFSNPFMNAGNARSDEALFFEPQLEAIRIFTPAEVTKAEKIMTTYVRRGDTSLSRFVDVRIQFQPSLQ